MINQSIFHSETLKIWTATIIASTVNLTKYLDSNNFLLLKEVLPLLSWSVTIIYTCIKVVQLLRRNNVKNN